MGAYRMTRYNEIYHTSLGRGPYRSETETCETETSEVVCFVYFFARDSQQQTDKDRGKRTAGPSDSLVACADKTDGAGISLTLRCPPQPQAVSAVLLPCRPAARTALGNPC